MKDGKSRHLGLVSAATFLGASNPVVVKHVLTAGFTPFLLGFFRTLFVLVFFSLWTGRDHRRIFGEAGEQRRWALWAAAAKAASLACNLGSLSMIPASRVAIITALSPVVSLVLVRRLLKHERFTAARVVGVLLGVAGLLALLWGQGPAPNVTPSAWPPWAGDALTLVGMVLVQAMIVFEKKALDAGVTPQQLSASSSVAAVALFPVLAFVAGERLEAVPVTVPTMAALFYLVTMTGGLQFYLKRWLTSVLDVSFLAAFQTPERVLSILMSWWLLGEHVPLQALGCLAVIMVGTAVAAREPHPD